MLRREGVGGGKASMAAENRVLGRDRNLRNPSIHSGGGRRKHHSHRGGRTANLLTQTSPRRSADEGSVH